MPSLSLKERADIEPELAVLRAWRSPTLRSRPRPGVLRRGLRTQLGAVSQTCSHLSASVADVSVFRYLNGQQVERWFYPDDPATWDTIFDDERQ